MMWSFFKLAHFMSRKEKQRVLYGVSLAGLKLIFENFRQCSNIVPGSTVYWQHQPVLHLDNFQTTGTCATSGHIYSKLLQEPAAPGLVHTTEACAALQGLSCTWTYLDNKSLCYIWTYLDYRSLCCFWTCLHYRGLCCTWTCLRHRGLSYTWTYLDNISLCYIWTYLNSAGNCWINKTSAFYFLIFIDSLNLVL